MMWQTAAAIGISYLLGSIPTGLWFGKALRGIDIREHGSRNIGATNTLRVLGKKLGALAGRRPGQGARRRPAGGAVTQPLALCAPGLRPGSHYRPRRAGVPQIQGRQRRRHQHGCLPGAGASRHAVRGRRVRRRRVCDAHGERSQPFRRHRAAGCGLRPSPRMGDLPYPRDSSGLGTPWSGHHRGIARVGPAPHEPAAHLERGREPVLNRSASARPGHLSSVAGCPLSGGDSGAG